MLFPKGGCAPPTPAPIFFLFVAMQIERILDKKEKHATERNESSETTTFLRQTSCLPPHPSFGHPLQIGRGKYNLYKSRLLKVFESFLIIFKKATSQSVEKILMQTLRLPPSLIPSPQGGGKCIIVRSTVTDYSPFTIHTSLILRQTSCLPTFA